MLISSWASFLSFLGSSIGECREDRAKEPRPLPNGRPFSFCFVVALRSRRSGGVF